jgi:hypothetical protein
MTPVNQVRDWFVSWNCQRFVNLLRIIQRVGEMFGNQETMTCGRDVRVPLPSVRPRPERKASVYLFDVTSRVVGQPESAGINRHVVGDERALQERNSESILALSLAGDIVRCRLKRRQRYRWAGLLSFEKPMEQDADSVPRGGRQHNNHAKREWIVGPA